MIKLLQKLFGKNYSISIKGPSIYVVWHRRIDQWPSHVIDKYLSQLRDAMSKTVTPETWKMLQENQSHDSNLYNAYVEEVKQQLCKDFNLDIIKNEVVTGHYHNDMLVISFKGIVGVTYPYYYRAIQLKP